MRRATGSVVLIVTASAFLQSCVTAPRPSQPSDSRVARLPSFPIINTPEFIDGTLVNVIPRQSAIDLLARESAKRTAERRCAISDRGVRSVPTADWSTWSPFGRSSFGALNVEVGGANSTTYRSVIVLPGFSDCRSLTTNTMQANGCFVYSEPASAELTRTFAVVLTALASLQAKACVITSPYPRIP